MANIEISTLTRNNDGNTYIIKDANAIPRSGSSAISGDLIPSSDGTVNLGSSSKQFNIIHSTSVINHNTGADLWLSNANDGADMALCPKEYYSGLFRIRAYDGTTRQTLQGNANGTLTWSGNVIRPNNNNTCDLGTSTYKWKSINGIAPDELGLPTSTYTDVSSYITNFNTSPNTFTAPASGLLNILAGPHQNIACAASDNTIGIVVSSFNDGYNHSRIILPVEKGHSISVYVNVSTGVNAIIYHLKGKV